MASHKLSELKSGDIFQPILRLVSRAKISKLPEDVKLHDIGNGVAVWCGSNNSKEMVFDLKKNGTTHYISKVNAHGVKEFYRMVYKVTNLY